MIGKVRTTVMKATRPVYLAALFAILFFAASINNQSAGNPDIIARHAIYTSIFFACMWAACRLFTDSLNRRIRLEGYEPETASDMIYTFVIYLEAIKHVVGISFTLGWIAGVMACWEFLGDRFVLVPLGVSIAVSLTAFLVTYGLSTFTDHLRWPAKDEDQ